MCFNMCAWCRHARGRSCHTTPQHTTQPRNHHNHHNHHKAFPPKRGSFVAFCVKPQRLMMDVERDAGGGTGCARRRRERRLRSMLRHERMSVAMALAESTHLPHSARRRQGREERHELYFTATFRRRLSPRVPGQQVAGNRGPRVGDLLYEEEPGGSRPPCLGEPRGPQDQNQLHTMEQAAAYAPMVQILDIPVPQLVDQLADVMRFFDTLLPVPEQAIEVPKTLLVEVLCTTPHIYEQKTAQTMATSRTCLSTSR